MIGLRHYIADFKEMMNFREKATVSSIKRLFSKNMPMKTGLETLNSLWMMVTVVQISTDQTG